MQIVLLIGRSKSVARLGEGGLVLKEKKKSKVMSMAGNASLSGPLKYCPFIMSFV